MTWYNQARNMEVLLAKHQAHPPSFTVNLHAEHWTLNNGPKFLYNNHFASILDDIRAQQIPSDFLDLFEAARTPFYEGCLIVELIDYRPRKPHEVPLDIPTRNRTVLQPTSESLWADICLLNAKHGNKWSDMDSLEVESKILLATSPALCLDPDPNITRMVNRVAKVSTPPIPNALKRKASAVVQEDDETDKARRAKIMQFMNTRTSRPTNFRLLDIIQKAKQAKTDSSNGSQPQQPPPNAPTPSHVPSPAPPPQSTQFVKQPLPPPAQQEKAKETPMAFNLQNPPVPQAPAPIQQFIAQNMTKTNTPSPRTQTPHQAPAFVVQTQDTTSRNSTPSKQQQQASPPHIPPAAPTQTPVTFQAAIPGAQFLQQIPTVRGNQNKMSKTAVPAPGAPQQQPPTAMNQQQMYVHRMMYQQQAMMAQQQQTPHVQVGQPGQPQHHPTPQPQQPPVQVAAQPVPTPGQIQQQQMYQYQQQQQHHAQAQLQSGRTSVAPAAVPSVNAIRASPHLANQRVASRSPMPPQAPQPAQPTSQAQAYQYNPANAAQYRSASTVQGAAPAQPGAVYTYGYPQMYAMQGRQQQMYWQARMPQMGANGQLQGVNLNLQQFQQMQMHQAQQQQQQQQAGQQAGQKR